MLSLANGPGDVWLVCRGRLAAFHASYSSGSEPRGFSRRVANDGGQCWPEMHQSRRGSLEEVRK